MSLRLLVIFPAPVHIQIAVAQHLRVDAQDPADGLGQHLPTALGQRADAQLQGGASSMFSTTNSAMRVSASEAGGGLYTGQRVMGALHDHIHVVDVDALVQAAVDPRQILVDLPGSRYPALSSTARAEALDREKLK